MKAYYLDITKKGTTDKVVKLTKDDDRLFATIMDFEKTPLTIRDYVVNVLSSDTMRRLRRFLKENGYRIRRPGRMMILGTGPA
jgi:hypothetical protein